MVRLEGHSSVQYGDVIYVFGGIDHATGLLSNVTWCININEVLDYSSRHAGVRSSTTRGGGGGGDGGGSFAGMAGSSLSGDVMGGGGGGFNSSGSGGGGGSVRGMALSDSVLMRRQQCRGHIPPPRCFHSCTIRGSFMVVVGGETGSIEDARMRREQQRTQLETARRRDYAVRLKKRERYAARLQHQKNNNLRNNNNNQQHYDVNDPNYSQQQQQQQLPPLADLEDELVGSPLYGKGIEECMLDDEDDDVISNDTDSDDGGQSSAAGSTFTGKTAVKTEERKNRAVKRVKQGLVIYCLNLESFVWTRHTLSYGFENHDVWTLKNQEKLRALQKKHAKGSGPTGNPNGGVKDILEAFSGGKGGGGTESDLLRAYQQSLFSGGAMGPAGASGDAGISVVKSQRNVSGALVAATASLVEAAGLSFTDMAVAAVKRRSHGTLLSCPEALLYFGGYPVEASQNGGEGGIPPQGRSSTNHSGGGNNDGNLGDLYDGSAQGMFNPTDPFRRTNSKKSKRLSGRRTQIPVDPVCFYRLFQVSGNVDISAVDSVGSCPMLWGHTATRVHNSVIVFGGVDARGGSETAAMCIYSLEDRRWRWLDQQPTIKTSSNNANTTANGSSVKSSLKSSSKLKSPTSANSADFEGAMREGGLTEGELGPSPRALHTSVLHRGKLLVYGGFNTSENLSANSGVGGGGGHNSDDSPYGSDLSMGGAASRYPTFVNGYLSDTWCFNLSTGMWELWRCGGDDPVARSGHSSLTHNDFMIVIGGLETPLIPDPTAIANQGYVNNNSMGGGMDNTSFMSRQNTSSYFGNTNNDSMSLPFAAVGGKSSTSHNSLRMNSSSSIGAGGGTRFPPGIPLIPSPEVADNTIAVLDTQQLMWRVRTLVLDVPLDVAMGSLLPSDIVNAEAAINQEAIRFLEPGTLRSPMGAQDIFQGGGGGGGSSYDRSPSGAPRGGSANPSYSNNNNMLGASISGSPPGSFGGPSITPIMGVNTSSNKMMPPPMPNFIRSGSSGDTPGNSLSKLPTPTSHTTTTNNNTSQQQQQQPSSSRSHQLPASHHQDNNSFNNATYELSASTAPSITHPHSAQAPKGGTARSMSTDRSPSPSGTARGGLLPTATAITQQQPSSQHQQPANLFADVPMPATVRIPSDTTAPITHAPLPTTTTSADDVDVYVTGHFSPRENIEALKRGGGSGSEVDGLNSSNHFINNNNSIPATSIDGGAASGGGSGTRPRSSSTTASFMHPSTGGGTAGGQPQLPVGVRSPIRRTSSATINSQPHPHTPSSSSVNNAGGNSSMITPFDIRQHQPDIRSDEREAEDAISALMGRVYDDELSRTSSRPTTPSKPNHATTPLPLHPHQHQHQQHNDGLSASNRSSIVQQHPQQLSQHQQRRPSVDWQTAVHSDSGSPPPPKSRRSRTASKGRDDSSSIHRSSASPSSTSSSSSSSSTSSSHSSRHRRRRGKNSRKTKDKHKRSLSSSNRRKHTRRASTTSSSSDSSSTSSSSTSSSSTTSSSSSSSPHHRRRRSRGGEGADDSPPTSASLFDRMGDGFGPKSAATASTASATPKVVVGGYSAQFAAAGGAGGGGSSKPMSRTPSGQPVSRGVSRSVSGIPNNTLHVPPSSGGYAAIQRGPTATKSPSNPSRRPSAIPSPTTPLSADFGAVRPTLSQQARNRRQQSVVEGSPAPVSPVASNAGSTYSTRVQHLAKVRAAGRQHQSSASATGASTPTNHPTNDSVNLSVQIAELKSMLHTNQTTMEEQKKAFERERVALIEAAKLAAIQAVKNTTTATDADVTNNTNNNAHGSNTNSPTVDSSTASTTTTGGKKVNGTFFGGKNRTGADQFRDTINSVMNNDEDEEVVHADGLQTSPTLGPFDGNAGNINNNNNVVTRSRSPLVAMHSSPPSAPAPNCRFFNYYSSRDPGTSPATPATMTADISSSSKTIDAIRADVLSRSSHHQQQQTRSISPYVLAGTRRSPFYNHNNNISSSPASNSRLEYNNYNNNNSLQQQQHPHQQGDSSIKRGGGGVVGNGGPEVKLFTSSVLTSPPHQQQYQQHHETPVRRASATSDMPMMTTTPQQQRGASVGGGDGEDEGVDDDTPATTMKSASQHLTNDRYASVYVAAMSSPHRGRPRFSSPLAAAAYEQALHARQ